MQAYASERLLAGTFIAYIATSPDREEVARRGLLGEFAKLRETEVTAEELERAKTYAIGTRAIRQESGAAVLGELVDAWLYGSGLHELDEHDGRIRAVTTTRDPRCGAPVLRGGPSCGRRRARRGQNGLACTGESRRAAGLVEMIVAEAPPTRQRC